MNSELNIKELISKHIDGEASPEEMQIVEQAIKGNEPLRKYYEELKQVQAALKSWDEEDLSPDLEQKLYNSLPGQAPRKGEEKMQLTRRYFAQLSTLLVLIMVIAVSLQVYTKRGIQGRIKSAADDIGEQFSPGNGNVMKAAQSVSPTAPSASAERREFAKKDKGGYQMSAYQYEPYYLTSNHAAPQEAGKLAAIGAKTAGGFQRQSYDPAVLGMETDLLDESRTIALYRVDTDGRYCDSIRCQSAPGNTEEYQRIYENEFLEVAQNPLSTLSIDVDTASYANVRRYLMQWNQLPPADAVRIEEMINYFDYQYPQPTGEHPFSVTIDAAQCPWNSKHQLARIGIQGKTLGSKEIPPSNLVFLIDVSGSMADQNKLPLLKTAFKKMVNQLSENENVALVVYAGAAGMVLDSTPGSNKRAILDAIDRLQSGGSTAGGAGIQLAYQIAKSNFIKRGNNRVILATDGDFNVGVSSTSEMIRLIEEKRKDGIFLTVLGFGTGNYKDERMEQIADKGNGNFYYIDTEKEGEKVLVQELGSTLFAIAKDVKIQIEFNPAQVKAYRLIGYENRVLAKEDFNDDTKDAGELGAGHTVTALYELVPADSKEEFRKVDPLVYRKGEAVQSKDLMTVKLRYKKPDEDVSKLIQTSVTHDEIKTEPKGDFQFASAVAEFGLLLRNSQFKNNASYENVLQSAQESLGNDKFGYRQEFQDIVKKAQSLDNRPGTDTPEPGDPVPLDPDKKEGGGMFFKGKADRAIGTGL